MKNFLCTALAATLLFAAQLAFGQQSRKVDAALDGFKNTPFMQQYLDLRTQMETAARSFKATVNNGGEHPVDPADVRLVMEGYEKSVARANAILRGIVTDFLDPKKMKFIAKLPDSYAKGLELDLRNLNDFQTQNFMQPLADVTADQVDGVPVLLLVIQLVSLTSELTNYLVDMRMRERQFTADYLEQNLYEACRFHAWDELDNGWQNSDPNRRTKIDLPTRPDLPTLDTRFDSQWEGAGN